MYENQALCGEINSSTIKEPFFIKQDFSTIKLNIYSWRRTNMFKD